MQEALMLGQARREAPHMRRSAEHFYYDEGFNNFLSMSSRPSVLGGSISF
jgi:hypothetical protein